LIHIKWRFDLDLKSQIEFGQNKQNINHG